MSYNLSLLSSNVTRRIELSRQAGLLVYKFKKGKVSRVDISKAINELPEHEQVDFKRLLNKYKDLK